MRLERELILSNDVTVGRMTSRLGSQMTSGCFSGETTVGCDGSSLKRSRWAAETGRNRWYRAQPFSPSSFAVLIRIKLAAIMIVMVAVTLFMAAGGNHDPIRTPRSMPTTLPNST
ncbi:MAG: hypothetical protein K0S45_1961 [Nitrospira sp.]|nr:hypothetical protein [Nitrospira sp.]